MKKIIDVNKLLTIPMSISEKFHKKTKLKEQLPFLHPKDWPKEWKDVKFKAYARFEELKLPKAHLSNTLSYKKVLFKRMSQRIFSNKRISNEKLSALLYYSAGLKTFREPWTGNRFYPSAGSRYPLETYVITINSELPQGIYHYYLKNHSLEKIRIFDNFGWDKFVTQPGFKNPACLIVLTAVFKRNTIKYGDRGYRFVLMESGHLSQNFYLTAVSIWLGCCLMGGFQDDKFNQLIDIDGKEESVLAVLVIGEK